MPINTPPRTLPVTSPLSLGTTSPAPQANKAPDQPVFIDIDPNSTPETAEAWRNYQAAREVRLNSDAYRSEVAWQATFEERILALVETTTAPAIVALRGPSVECIVTLKFGKPALRFAKKTASRSGKVKL